MFRHTFLTRSEILQQTIPVEINSIHELGVSYAQCTFSITFSFSYTQCEQWAWLFIAPSSYSIRVKRSKTLWISETEQHRICRYSLVELFNIAKYLTLISFVFLSCWIEHFSEPVIRFSKTKMSLAHKETKNTWRKFSLRSAINSQIKTTRFYFAY